MECAEAYADVIQKECESACDSKFWGYVDQIIELYHKDDLIVQGDELYHGQPVADSVFEISKKEIDCMAQALVDKCRGQCTLTGTPSSNDATVVASVGTAGERAAFMQALNYNVQLSRWNGSACTDPQAERLSKLDTLL